MKNSTTKLSVEDNLNKKITELEEKLAQRDKLIKLQTEAIAQGAMEFKEVSTNYYKTYKDLQRVSLAFKSIRSCIAGVATQLNIEGINPSVIVKTEFAVYSDE